MKTIQKMPRIEDKEGGIQEHHGSWQSTRLQSTSWGLVGQGRGTFSPSFGDLVMGRQQQKQLFKTVFGWVCAWNVASVCQDSGYTIPKYGTLDLRNSRSRQVSLTCSLPYRPSRHKCNRRQGMSPSNAGNPLDKLVGLGSLSVLHQISLSVFQSCFCTTVPWKYSFLVSLDFCFWIKTFIKYICIYFFSC